MHTEPDEKPCTPLRLENLVQDQRLKHEKHWDVENKPSYLFLNYWYSSKLKKTNQLIVKSKGNFQASYATYDDGETGSFGNSGVFIPRVFNHILQLLVEVPTSEIDGTNSTLEFSPLLCQLTEEEPSEQIRWDSQNKVSSAIQSSLDSDCFTPDTWF